MDELSKGKKAICEKRMLLSGQQVSTLHKRYTVPRAHHHTLLTSPFRKRFIFLLSTCLCLLTLTTLSIHAKADESQYKNTTNDLAIINGRVIDPESGLDEKINIGISGSKIEAITPNAVQAKRIIDAKGLIVSPGFIDLHAHGQIILSGRVQALDGITTALELEAGFLPIQDYYDQMAKEGRPINYGASVNWSSARIAVINRIKINDTEKVSELFFSNPLWQKKSIANDEQLAQISTLVNQGLDEGGLGVGFLSGYAPDTGHKEYHHISELAAQRGVPTFTHGRYLSMLDP